MILRACPEGSRETVAQLLGRAFSLKDSTCVSIAGSTPIVLLTELTKADAAALCLVLAGLEQLGASMELTTNDVSELPKIDWPRRPLVFKRDITEYANEFANLSLTIPGAGKSFTLMELMTVRLDPNSRPAGNAPRPSTEFRGAQLPEVTPFSNQALSSRTPPPMPSAAPRPMSPVDTDAVSRLNEMFPEEEAGFMPNNDDITSILDRLLPDEEQSQAQPGSGPTGIGSASGRMAVVSAPQGFSVFLAKITDEAKRTKAVPLLVELGGLSKEEADTLSKKVIIPVLKGASKEEAEAAKQKFAKIGILARIKGP
jgi:ribosomal protein L7/L12